jgi:putative FmdB family regulatory protein
MPTYEYACRRCGHRVEVVQSLSDPPLTTCGVCGGELRKVFHPAGVLFKGSGFYSTDNRAKPKEREGASSAEAGKGDREAASAGTSGSDGAPAGDAGGSGAKRTGSGGSSGAGGSSRSGGSSGSGGSPASTDASASRERP